jgi:hypothetical protein
MEGFKFANDFFETGRQYEEENFEELNIFKKTITWEVSKRNIATI